ncbi:MAG: carbon-nitrogen hydrolase family protein [Pseudomonadales bacterium]|nr:carbon-nitrogen hydrolase family protein [Pseudomonadales bacterium]MCP5183566.1 carbon-nitrogen hydrolase family protein [Pseudomonadales bacterium]
MSGPAPYTAAVIQWAPCVHDPVAGAARAALAIDEAARNGARLIVFPETWLQGYPYFSGLKGVDPEFQAYLHVLHDAAITRDGTALQPVMDAAARSRAHVVISAHEKAGGTLYNTQFDIGPAGQLLGTHRKLMPTLQERLVWGMGDGSDLTVYDTPLGRLGGLLCFEHHMAPARYALNGLGIQVHAAQWPGQPFLNDIVDAAIRQTAFENGCFVLSAREVMDQSRIQSGMPPSTCDPMHYLATGGSAIVAPDGQYVAGPVYDEETIVYGQIDLTRITRTKVWFDGTGHYARPDIFQLRWDRRPKRPVDIVD